MSETRCVQIPMAPPRRLAPGARFRSFKRGPDHGVWDRVMAPVLALVADGWHVVSAVVDWGKTRPLANDARLRTWIAEMTDATDVSWTWSGRGKGSTAVCLERESAYARIKARGYPELTAAEMAEVYSGFRILGRVDDDD